MRHNTLFVVILVVLLCGMAPLFAQQGLTEAQVTVLKESGKSDEEIQVIDAALRGQPVSTRSVSESVVTIPRKTIVQIKVLEELSSKKTEIGPFKCVVDRDVKIGGTVLIEEGGDAVCRVVSKEGGSFAVKKGTLKIAVDSVTAIDGTSVMIDYSEAHGGGGRSIGRFGTETKVKAGTILPAVVDEKVDVKIPSVVRAGVK